MAVQPGTKKKKKHKLPLPVLLLILGIITPVEFSLVIGTVHIMPHRIPILIFIIPAMNRVFGGKVARASIYDYLFVAYNCWMLFAFMAHMDVQPGLQYGGSLVVESLGGYLIARAYIRTYEDFMAALNWLFRAVCFVGLLAMPEAFTGLHYVHVWLKAIASVEIAANDEVRWGLHRSYATFNHPILYGAFCASLLSMVWFTEKNTGAKIGKAAALFLATFWGLSSAPLNSLFVQAALGGFHRATARFPNRMKILGLMFVALYISLLLFTNTSPVAAIVTHITFDAQTAYYRTLIWGFGLNNVWANPWLGLGLDPWVRPEWMHSDSVDAYWLIVTMQQGIPAIVIHIAAVWFLIAAVHSRGPGQRSKREQRAAVGWTLSFTAFALAGCTVHYWDSTHTYLFFLLGMGGWLADPLKVKVKAKKKVGAVAAPERSALPALSGWPEPAYAAGYEAGLSPMVG